MHVSPLQSGDPFLECTTRKVSKGEVSTFMHDKMEVGAKVLLGVPAGLFTAKVLSLIFQTTTHSTLQMEYIVP